MSGKDLDALNLTKLSKVLPQVVLLVLSWEVFDKEVALLFGVLESHLLSHDDTLSLNLIQGRLHIELAAVDLLIVEFLDSSLSRNEASIFIVGVLEANEGKLALGLGGVLLDED